MKVRTLKHDTSSMLPFSSSPRPPHVLLFPFPPSRQLVAEKADLLKPGTVFITFTKAIPSDKCV
jgi:hypothetical protein